MRKLFIIAIAGLFSFASCGNKPAATTEPEVTQEETKCEGEHKCCKELTPEQKAEMEAWNNWDTQTDEQKAELVEKRKECIDKFKAEKEAKCHATEGEQKEECPEKAAKCAKMKETLDNWDNLTIEDQKAFFDAMAAECKEKCNKEKKEECKDKE